MIRRPPRSTRTDTLFPTRRSSDLEVEDDLPLYLFRQDKARVWGFEFEGAAPLAQIGGFHIGADVTADMTRAKIDNGPYIPRIPPLRILGGIEAKIGRASCRERGCQYV